MANSRYAELQSAFGKEKYAIANRPSGWTAREAQRAHRRANAKAVKAQKRA